MWRIGKHVVCVFRLSNPFKMGLGVKLIYPTRFQFWHPQIIFSCFLSRHGPERFVLNSWIPTGSKRSNGPGCPIVYMVWTRLPRNPDPNMCVRTTMILTRKFKNLESVIRKWKIGTYRLVIHPVTYGLIRFILVCVVVKNWHRKRPNPSQIGKIRFMS